MGQYDNKTRDAKARAFGDLQAFAASVQSANSKESDARYEVKIKTKTKIKLS